MRRYRDAQNLIWSALTKWVLSLPEAPGRYPLRRFHHASIVPVDISILISRATD